MSDRFDVIVVGGGAMGLSAAYSCARTGKRVLVLEQFRFFNERGSSKGLSRFFRIVYSDALLCLLARSAYPLWQELERESGETLIAKTGVLFYGISESFSREGNLKKCKDVMDQLGIAYEEYDAGQLKERFSTLKDVPNSASGLFQADAGFTHAERTLRALYKLAKGHGASLRWQGRRSTISGRFRSSGRGFWVSEMCGLRNKSLSTRNPKFAGGYKPCELIRLR